VQGVLEFLKTLGASRIAAMGAVTVALVGVFAFFIPRVTAPWMTPLFTDLAFEDSAAVVLVEEKLGVTMTEIIKVERA
jgi:flagellar M-ring protein FliF